MSSPPVRVTLLGGLSASIEAADPVTADPLGPGKPLVVLAFLDTADGRTSTRQTLAGLLWPGVGDAQARQSLRQCLWQLRQRFGDDVLVTEGDTVTLGPRVTSDRDDFLAACRAGRWLEAVTIHKGPFGPVGLHLGGAELEEWTGREAEFIRRRFLDAASRALPELVRAGWCEEGRRLAERVRDADPGSQAAWRTVLDLGGHTWSPAELRTEAARFERFLEEEELVPEPATRDLLARIGRTSERPTLVGRAATMARLTAARLETERGAGRWIHVSGPPGIGKSRIVAELAALAETAGGSVAAVKGALGARELDRSLLDDLVVALERLRGARGASASSLAALDPSERGIETARLIEALRDLVDAIAAERQLVMVIDDLHWADPISVAVFRGLGARLPERVLLVTASRPQAGGGGPEASIIELEAFSIAESERLVASLATLPDTPWRGPFVETLHRVTAGNPLLLRETLRLMTAEGHLAREDHRWTSADPDALLRRLAEGAVIESRLAGQTPFERTVLEVLASVGTDLPLDAVTAAVDTSADQVRTALLRLESAGLVVVRGRAWTMSHDLIAEAIVSTIPRPTRNGHHLRVGRHLAAHAGRNLWSIRAAAHHFVEGDSLPDLAIVWRQWVGEARRAGDRSPPARLLTDLLGDRLPAPWRRALLPGRGRVIAGVAALVVLATGVGALALAARPHRISIVTVPFTGGASLVPAPAVEVLDWWGRRVDTGSPMTVRLHGGRKVTLAGDSVVPIVDGRATFDNLRFVWNVEGDSIVELRFASGDLESPPLRIDLDGWFRDGLRLWLVSGTIGGTPIDSVRRLVHVAAGGRITGTVQFRYTSRATSATTLFALTPTWGEPRTAWTGLLALQTPVMDARFGIDVDLEAPRMPGRYRLVFAFAYETNGNAIMSASNWVTAPVWGDGNDLATLPDSLYDRADREGGIRIPWLYAHERSPSLVPVTTMAIQVD